MKPIITKYQCELCETVYETQGQAEDCCSHIRKVYVCSDCDEEFYDNDEAEECCRDKKCVCGHTLGASHDNETTECEAWISNLVGDCPCERFEAEY